MSRLVVRAVVVGLGASLLAALVLRFVASPWLAVPWALALLVLAPSAVRLDRRLAVNLALVFGLVPLAMSVPPVAGARTGAVVALALATGAAVAGGVARPGSVRPVARTRDLLVAGSGVLAAAVAWPLRSPGDPDRALAMLSTGIDNAYHMAVFLELRLTSAGSPLAAVNADDTGFAFDDYPSWFHKLLTVGAEAAFGAPGSAPVELVHYAQLQWAAFVAVVVLVTAAFVQALPDRVPRSLLVVAAVALLGLVLGVPGGINLLQGHLSFFVAACAPLVMVLLAAPVPRPGIGLFVVLGGLVLVTASWLLLLPMAAAALVVPVVLVWQRQRPLVRWAAVAGAALAVLAAFLVFVLGPLTAGGLFAVLRDGTIPRVGLPTTVPVLLGAVVLLGRAALRRREVPLAGHALVALAAALQTGVLGGYMLVETGRLTYYFWKLALGSLLVVVALSAHALVVARAGRPEGSGGLRPILAGVLGLVGAFGLGGVLQNFTLPSAAWAGLVPVSLANRPGSGDAGDVGLVLRLATSTSPADAARTRLLATRPEDMNAAHASEWFHVLSYSATRRAMSVDDGVYDLAEDRGDLALGVRLAQSTLATPDGRVLVTDPRLEAAIRAAVTPEQAGRVGLVR